MATVWLNEDTGLSLRSGIIYAIDKNGTIIKELSQRELLAIRHVLSGDAHEEIPYTIDDDNKEELQEFIDFYYDV